MKKTILTILQLLVTLGILVWIFHDHNTRIGTVDAMKHATANPGWIVLGIAAYGVVEIFAALRWQILLRVQGVNLSFWRVARLMMIGILFNPLMPGGTGGDVIKIFYLIKETPGKKVQALLAVLMDRLIGLFGLILVAGVTIGLQWNWLTQGQTIPHFEMRNLLSYQAMRHWLQPLPTTTILLYSLLALLGMSIFGVLTSFVVTGLGLVHKLPARLPLRDKLVDLAVAYNAYASAWKSSLVALLVSMGVHVSSFYVFYAAGMALQTGVPLTRFFAVMPIINTLASLPISVGGTGPREFFFETIFRELCHLKQGLGTSISLLGFAMLVFWAIIGGVIYLFYRPSEHARISDIQDAVHDLEHEVAKGK